MKYSSLLGHTVEVLGEIQGSDLPADSIIGQFFRSRKYLGSRDRRFIAETTYGVLRHRARCDETLRRSGADPARMTPDGRALLEALAYLIAVEGRQDVSSADVAELLSGGEETVEAKSMTDVMERMQTEPPDVTTMEPAVRYSFQPWLVDRLRVEYGPVEAEQILASLNEPAPLTIRVNTLKATVTECRERLAADGIESQPGLHSPWSLVIPKRFNIFGLAAFKDGWFEVQDEGSQLLPLLVDPKPTAKVLDACAGAGGKTLAFAALMKNRGEIVAADVHEYRLEELRKRSRRAGTFNIRIQRTEKTSDLATTYADSFDVVFVDAPCSGIGTIRRNPGMKWTVHERTVAELSRKQYAILDQASALVRPGGMLVYATCTLLAQENEEVIARFLVDHSEFQTDPPSERLAEIELSNALVGKYVKLLPHRHGTDGFFCAFLRKAQDHIAG
ncbi:MAG: methyltransferase domain-containing protein [Bacteroidota bacterium]